jgi:putative hydrolase of the HAD superfamily
LIRHALFDLDNTLYENPRHRDEMDNRIELFFQKRLSLEPSWAHALRVQYRTQYGTALRGLMIHHQVDPNEFLDHVHRGLPLEPLDSPPDARRILSLLACPRSIFSNAPGDYAARMLEVLGLGDLFSNIYGIDATAYIGKPDPEAYAFVLSSLGASGQDCLFVEDTPANLAPAKALGMTTVYLGPAQQARGREKDIDHQVERFAELSDVFISLRGN